MNKKYDYPEKQLIIDLYLSGKSMESIAKELNCGYMYVNKTLHKFGVHIRTILENSEDKNLNHNFFNSFNKNSCYWAGFIAADGNVLDFKKSKVFRLSIELSIKDIFHIQKFKENINSNKKIYTRNRKSFYKDSWSAKISLHSENLLNDLYKNFNICPRKSLILLPPENIPEEFIMHFIRGYLDGDGYIEIAQQRIGFLGTKEMLEWIKNNIRKYCNICSRNQTIKKEGNIYRLRFGGNQVMEILYWLYNDSDEKIRLDRKYNLYLKLKEFSNEQISKRH